MIGQYRRSKEVKGNFPSDTSQCKLACRKAVAVTEMTMHIRVVVTKLLTSEKDIVFTFYDPLGSATCFQSE